LVALLPVYWLQVNDSLHNLEKEALLDLIDIPHLSNQKIFNSFCIFIQ